MPPILLPEIENEELMQIEGRWVSDMVRCWLDEEWTPLEVHRDLGEAAGQVGVHTYKTCERIFLSQTTAYAASGKQVSTASRSAPCSSAQQTVISSSAHHPCTGAGLVSSVS